MNRTMFRRTPARLMFVTDDTESGAGQQGSQDGDAGESTADDAEGTEGTEGDADQDKDWKAEFEAQQRINRSLERKGKKDLARIQALEAAASSAGSGDADGTPDVDKIRAEVEAEVSAKAHDRLKVAEAKAALAGKVNISPALAVKLLDLSEVEVDADGNVDAEALSDAVAKLLTDEPHLAVAQGTRFQGSADQGPRGSTKSEEQQLNEEIAAAEKARDFTRAIGLKQRLAALAASRRT